MTHLLQPELCHNIWNGRDHIRRGQNTCNHHFGCRWSDRNGNKILQDGVTLPSVLRENGVFTHITTDHTHYFEIGGENYCYLFNTWDYHRGQEFDTWISRVNQPLVDPESYGKKSSQYLLNRTRFTKEEEYPSPRTFRSACSWVEQNKGADDFFLMVESFDPHEPFDCPEKYHQMYNDNYVGREFCWPTYAEVTEPADAVEHLEKCYLGTLSMADYWFGRLLETLKENVCMRIRLLFLRPTMGIC